VPPVPPRWRATYGKSDRRMPISCFPLVLPSRASLSCFLLRSPSHSFLSFFYFFIFFAQIQTRHKTYKTCLQRQLTWIFELVKRPWDISCLSSLVVVFLRSSACLIAAKLPKCPTSRFLSQRILGHVLQPLKGYGAYFYYFQHNLDWLSLCYTGLHDPQGYPHMHPRTLWRCLLFWSRETE
jgi:hypothetical protein